MADDKKEKKPSADDVSLGSGAAEKVKVKIKDQKEKNLEVLNQVRKTMGLPPVTVAEVNKDKKSNSKYGVGK